MRVLVSAEMMGVLVHYVHTTFVCGVTTFEQLSNRMSHARANGASCARWPTVRRKLRRQFHQKCTRKRATSHTDLSATKGFPVHWTGVESEKPVA